MPGGRRCEELGPYGRTPLGRSSGFLDCRAAEDVVDVAAGVALVDDVDVDDIDASVRRLDEVVCSWWQWFMVMVEMMMVMMNERGRVLMSIA